ncbi:phage tail family protein [Eubacteriales bacterium OttesenSCG-928-A19]|nr:phage tail family protein [Eubacteriales bacterium OttesenSCG-928-A19]
MGFIYNGISSKAMKITARLTDWQASPSLRNSLIAIPGRAGVADFGATTGERVITVRCNIFPQRTFTGLVSVLDSVAEWLNPEYGLKQLVLDDVPDRYFTCRLSDALDCERVLRSSGAFELHFLCPDPHGYALTDEVFSISEAGEIVVRRMKGNTYSEPVYLLRGVIPSDASSYVSIQTNQDVLRVFGPLAEGETLVIDAGLVTAKVVDDQGATLRNGLPCLQELNFPVLEKGVNRITVAVAGEASFAELTIQAESRWR